MYFKYALDFSIVLILSWDRLVFFPVTSSWLCFRLVLQMALIITTVKKVTLPQPKPAHRYSSITSFVTMIASKRCSFLNKWFFKFLFSFINFKFFCVLLGLLAVYKKCITLLITVQEENGSRCDWLLGMNLQVSLILLYFDIYIPLSVHAKSVNRI